MTVKRDILKNFLKNGEQPLKPFVFPMIFGVAAKAEGLPPETFLLNATKLSNALRRIYQYHSYDCILTYFCNHLEEELVGCRVDRSSYPPSVQSFGGSAAFPVITDVDALPYGAIVKDVIQRLKIVIQGQQLLAGAILGPMKLASFVSDKGSEPDLETTALAILKLSQWLCQAGMDVIFFVEDVPPHRSDLFEEWWKNFYQIAKVIVFHEVLPVLMISTAEKTELDAIMEHVKGFLPCFICDDVETFSGTLDGLTLKEPFGIAVGLDTLLSPDVKGLKGIVAEHRDKITLLTTSGEIPYDGFEPGVLQEVADALKNILQV